MARGPRLAQWSTTCPRCDLIIAKNTPYVLHHGTAIHPGCAPGADDE